MKYTTEFLARCFAAYTGCRITCPGKSFIPNKNSSDGKGGIILSPSILADCHEGAFHYSDFKLKLRPLSAITDDDAIEVAKILLPQCFANCKNGWQVSRDFTITGYPYIKIHHQKKVFSVQIDCKLVNFDVQDMEDSVTSSTDMKPAVVIDYLRSIGIDCGYAHIPSLIAAGIAISA